MGISVKWAAALAAIVLLALGFVSCRRSNSESKPPPQPRTLTIWHTELDPEANRVLKEIGQTFAASRPGVSVEIQPIAWGDLNQRLQAAIISGQVPDLVHLQPYMTASLVRKGMLEPLDSVYDSIGMDDVYPAVRDLQLFDGKRYGIAHAVGTTFYAVRRDLMKSAGAAEVRTWDDYLQLVRSMTKRDANGKTEVYGVILPGTPFFLEQYFAELVSSNGGHLYDEHGRPTLTARPVIEALTFLRELARLAPPNWKEVSYLEQFKEFAAGRVASVPVFYARALKNIETDSPPGQGTPERFTFIPQPHGPSGNAGMATLDCEPWAVLRKAKNGDLAKEFLSELFTEDNYARFCATVPIHLTPVRISVANGSTYLNTPVVKTWGDWQRRSDEVLRSNRALPILFTRPEDRNVPYLLEFSGEQVLTKMILDTCVRDVEPREAAERAQARAEAIADRAIGR